MGKNSETVRCAMRVLLIATSISILVQADPVARVPPGCREHCNEYTKRGGRYSDCTPQCPSEEVCLRALAMTDHTEEYIDIQPGLPQRPKLCKNHCWQSNVYVMHSCMVDCPETWCRLYGGMVLPMTKTTTTTPIMITTRSITSTKSTTTLEANTGPKVHAVLDGSADRNGKATKDPPRQSNTNLGLSIGIPVTLFVVAVIVLSVIAYRYRRSQRKKGHVAVPMGAYPATSNDQTVHHLRS